jgi:RNA polymerase sigma-70 factor (ECF subfamily)
VSESAESLFARFAQRRTESNFRALYDRVTPGMLGLALRLCAGDRDSAEDVVQEAWSRVVDRVDRFDAAGSVGPWINGFVVRCWSEGRRHSLREVAGDDAALDAVASERDAGPWSEAPLLLRAVYALPDGFRAVLVLHDIEGYTHAEIAERLGIDEGTSKSQLSRARRKVREMLGVRHEA